MHPVLLIVVYLGVVLFPLAVSALSGTPPRSFWDEIASGAGLLAFAIILAEFTLSGRFRAVSRRIGMDVTMRMHQLLARAALALALIHPFLYAAPYQKPFPWDATRQLTVTSDLHSLMGGMLAWALLTPLALVAIGRERLGYSYETWRRIHGIGAALIAALLLHHTLHAGRYSQQPVLAWYWALMFAGALATLLWIYLVRPLLQRARPWAVKSVRPIGPEVWELTLSPDGHAGLSYEAGQFAWITVGASPFGVAENPFSIASAPAEGPDLRFVVKEQGDFTRRLKTIAPGERAYVDGPHGDLVIADHAASGIALIAGGVGVAPILSVMRQLRLTGDPRPITLIYGNRTVEQIAYPQELAALAVRPGGKVVHVLTDPPAHWSDETGLVDAALLKRCFGAPEQRDWIYALCGPTPMMDAVERDLIALGVPASRILSERFHYD